MGPASRSTASVSDAELIELARNGDRAAFGDLVERYQHVVFRAALAALRSREDAVNMIVSGFCKEVFRELPMEFAVEAQKLLGVSLEGSVG